MPVKQQANNEIHCINLSQQRQEQFPLLTFVFFNAILPLFTVHMEETDENRTWLRPQSGSGFFDD